MIVHIAGADVRVMDHLRQRCSWCGVLLVDYDLTRVMMAVPEGADPGAPSTWPVGALVAVDGHASWVVDPESSAEDPEATKLPPEACGLLPPEMTQEGLTL